MVRSRLIHALSRAGVDAAVGVIQQRRHHETNEERRARKQNPSRRRPSSAAAASAHWQRREDEVPVDGIEDYKESGIEKREREEAQWAWSKLLNVEADPSKPGGIARGPDGLRDDERELVRAKERDRVQRKKERREERERGAYGGGHRAIIGV
jgi:hypothetical protein